MTLPPLIHRIGIKNYRSIGTCDVHLGQLTFLVGRNGSGKSNFLDAIAFVQESLSESLDHAIKRRGGIDAVRRRSTGHPRNFGLTLDLAVADNSTARFSFEIAAQKGGSYRVKRESLRVNTDGVNHEYDVREGRLHGATVETFPVTEPNRFALVAASGLGPFRGTFEALRAMSVYNLNAEAMRFPSPPSSERVLVRDGSNVAGVIGRISERNPTEKNRIVQFLGTIVDGIVDVERKEFGGLEGLEFRQEVRGADHPWRFHAANMSDGTLRALGTLASVSQTLGESAPLRLAGIEEPETALHPAAASALVEALREAATETQVVITTHSADLLDHLSAEPGEILCVIREENETGIGHIDEASRAAIREHLFSAGDLLRLDQLRPAQDELESQRQLDLFAALDECVRDQEGEAVE